MADPQTILQFMVTEHTALQTARSATIFDANGRTTLYLTSVSSALVALAFIGQVSELSDGFFVFGLVLFPALLFIGVATFARVLQIAIEDAIYAMGINRIRHYYLEIAPEMQDYFILSSSDDMQGVLNNLGDSSRFQILLTTPGMVSVVNAILGGVIVGMLMYLVTRTDLLSCIISGGVTFAVLLWLHTRYQRRRWDAALQRHPPQFTSEQA